MNVEFKAESVSNLQSKIKDQVLDFVAAAGAGSPKFEVLPERISVTALIEWQEPFFDDFIIHQELVAELAEFFYLVRIIRQVDFEAESPMDWVRSRDPHASHRGHFSLLSFILENEQSIMNQYLSIAYILIFVKYKSLLGGNEKAFINFQANFTSFSLTLWLEQYLPD